MSSSVPVVARQDISSVAAEDPFDLRGRVALVTGSARGIGAGIAQALAAAGATVVIHGRDSRAVAVTADRLRTLPTRLGSARVDEVSFDVTDVDASRSAVTELHERLGSIDVLVNNAGVNNASDLLDTPLSDWNTIVATNLTSCFTLSQQVAPGMIERGRGKIINICSVHARLVRARVAAYAAAKSGLAGLTQVMCAAWAEHGIQTNGLSPGFIETEMTERMRSNPDTVRWLNERTPAGRWGTPADLGGTAVWLASQASDFVNGQVIYVDGGVTAVL